MMAHRPAAWKAGIRLIREKEAQPSTSGVSDPGATDTLAGRRRAATHRLTSSPRSGGGRTRSGWRSCRSLGLRALSHRRTAGLVPSWAFLAKHLRNGNALGIPLGSHRGCWPIAARHTDINKHKYSPQSPKHFRSRGQLLQEPCALGDGPGLGPGCSAPPATGLRPLQLPDVTPLALAEGGSSSSRVH